MVLGMGWFTVTKPTVPIVPKETVMNSNYPNSWSACQPVSQEAD